MIPIFTTSGLRSILLKRPQKPTAANRMAALRGQKPHLRHDDRHGIFQAMDLIEVALAHSISGFDLHRESNRFLGFVKFLKWLSPVPPQGVEGWLEGSNAAFELVPGKEFSGAFGGRSRNIAVSYDIPVGNAVEPFESDHEKNERIVHFIGKTRFAVITHDRDPDRFSVPIPLLGMSAVHLLHPARADLDLTVRFSTRAVIDQKIVPHPVLPTTFLMKTINAIGASLIGRGMMNNNVGPSRGRKKRDIRPRTPRIRDQKFHPLLELRLVR